MPPGFSNASLFLSKLCKQRAEGGKKAVWGGLTASDMKSVVGRAEKYRRLCRPEEVDGSDIGAGIWVCGVGPRDPSSNVQRAGEQACLGSVPLESPGDMNRHRCEEEGPRGGGLGVTWT